MNIQSYLIYNRYRFKNLHKIFTFKTKTIDEIIKFSRNQIYMFFLDYFYFHSKSFVRKHRNYFKTNKRGFGEDAFHGMWDFLFLNYKPKLILEIGIYRGQTLSLFNYLSDYYQLESEVWGVAPLTSAGQSLRAEGTPLSTSQPPNVKATATRKYLLCTFLLATNDTI